MTVFVYDTLPDPQPEPAVRRKGGQGRWQRWDSAAGWVPEPVAPVPAAIAVPPAAPVKPKGRCEHNDWRKYCPPCQRARKAAYRAKVRGA